MRPSMRAVTSLRYRRFRAQLKTAREKAGIGQVELARAVRMTQPFVSKYESGERRLDVIELLEILRVLQLDPCTFIKKL
jgi:transcriptional regulator with XRE-family HTH domain